MNEYAITYYVDNDEGYYLISDEITEMFEGSEKELKEYIEALKKNKCYGIDLKCIFNYKEEMIVW